MTCELLRVNRENAWFGSEEDEWERKKGGLKYARLWRREVVAWNWNWDPNRKKKTKKERHKQNRSWAKVEQREGLLERARSNRQKQLPWHFQSPNSPSPSTSHSIPFDRCRFMLAMIFVTLMLFVISFLLLLPIARTTNSTRNATTTQAPVYCEILLLVEQASFIISTVHLSASVVAC